MNGTEKTIGFNLTITLLMAFDLVKNIVERFGPEHEAGGDLGGCIYAAEKDGILTPVCIVGQMFADLGILRTLVGTRETLDTALVSSPTDASGELLNVCGLNGDDVFNRLAEHFGIFVDEDARVFLRQCQAKQDEGSTWLRAFESGSQWLIETGRVQVENAKARDLVWAALNN